jgi:hypothetical protein
VFNGIQKSTRTGHWDSTAERTRMTRQPEQERDERIAKR